MLTRNLMEYLIIGFLPCFDFFPLWLGVVKGVSWTNIGMFSLARAYQSISSNLALTKLLQSTNVIFGQCEILDKKTQTLDSRVSFAPGPGEKQLWKRGCLSAYVPQSNPGTHAQSVCLGAAQMLLASITVGCCKDDFEQVRPRFKPQPHIAQTAHLCKKKLLPCVTFDIKAW